MILPGVSKTVPVEQPKPLPPPLLSMDEADAEFRKLFNSNRHERAVLSSALSVLNAAVSNQRVMNDAQDAAISQIWASLYRWRDQAVRRDKAIREALSVLEASTIHPNTEPDTIAKILRGAL